MADIYSHTIYSVSTSPMYSICTSTSHNYETYHTLKTFMQLRVQHQPHEEEKFSPRTPPKLQQLPLTHYQPAIIEILPRTHANDTHHHIKFISSSLGTMIHVSYSSFFGVENPKPTRPLVSQPMV